METSHSLLFTYILMISFVSNSRPDPTEVRSPTNRSTTAENGICCRTWPFGGGRRKLNVFDVASGKWCLNHGDWRNWERYRGRGGYLTSSSGSASGPGDSGSTAISGEGEGGELGVGVRVRVGGRAARGLSARKFPTTARTFTSLVVFSSSSSSSSPSSVNSYVIPARRAANVPASSSSSLLASSVAYNKYRTVVNLMVNMCREDAARAGAWHLRAAPTCLPHWRRFSAEAGRIDGFRPHAPLKHFRPYD